KDLARSGERRDAAGDVYGDPGDIGWTKFDLAGVEPGAQRNALLVRRVDERGCTAYGPQWSVERGEDAVAGGLDQFPAIFANDAAHHVVMVIEDPTPRIVATRGELLG